MFRHCPAVHTGGASIIIKEKAMELRHLNPESIRMSEGRNAGGRMRIESDDALGLLPPVVPILDIDVLDDEEFEPDGVNEFVRDFASRDDFEDL
jgi:hypothetical protein